MLVIKHIDTSQGRVPPGVKCVITAEDTPKIKYGNWRLFPETQDEYPLAVDKVRFIGDEVAAVAAIDKDTAEEALELIKVEYEELPAVFDVDSAMQAGRTGPTRLLPRQCQRQSKDRVRRRGKGFCGV